MLHISGRSSGKNDGINVNTLPNNMVVKHANINPDKYTNPLKSWLNIDANVKKHTNTNGAKRKNKYVIVIILSSI
jgi:hypothetical protein